MESLGCLREKKSNCRPSVSEEAVKSVKQNFVWSPWKSMRVVPCKLGTPQKTARKMVRKNLNFKSYYLYLTQQIAENDKSRMHSLHNVSCPLLYIENAAPRTCE
ncbi:hypothetical protein TNCV_4629961 [Trichonephila clavipes]|nr:hypothetical protein TNCV_4629961 [Trichonephila clavipes]